MDHHMRESARKTNRRTVLALAGSAALAAVAGCLGDDEDAPDPEALTGDDICEACGMEVTQHPGPVGQAFYDDHPDLEDGRAAFCSGTCTFGWTLMEADAGYDAEVRYLTDYSTVDWSIEEDGDDAFLSPHFDAEDQADVETLTVLAGSDLYGAMGEDIIGFAEESDAEELQDEYGGEVLAAEDVTRELVDSLGGGM